MVLFAKKHPPQQYLVYPIKMAVCGLVVCGRPNQEGNPVWRKRNIMMDSPLCWDPPAPQIGRAHV